MVALQGTQRVIFFVLAGMRGLASLESRKGIYKLSKFAMSHCKSLHVGAINVGAAQRSVALSMYVRLVH